ncbi:helix-turn-helix domain-containing protein [Streptomyces stelliscabiei]|jgi:transcriptional regulator with XRE-family HTH domain|uniref:Transcriptional regulator with XRE-family HTH domain n=2 Tax=Streptomyces TaxID=1883 RepID=A0A8I0P514_9ACTN|nr:helix-turn-helix transcriptional regulator [Streptomyces stelliscabiei]MBE1599668.1 transcriptional regulator with XRE-family HTH domain [Streptomyces stelliscabiei]MDX2519333.1 helix-turn-helix transcriptional regulator [Streptomyces stelliscabiei]MDX2549737.1 helix-turn-helix transcriptional regulator [Streptomyces stelliscabiei]MDX2616168.1 helix-turn-helix transcriptional regulator [Streptomyces stelliscabiei]MDX2634144.1 helix-turn-helix transcriptional regulator [Streptomyces stellisc
MKMRAARRTARLTQQQLADRIECEVKSISRWENGYRAPDLNDLIRIADALGVPLADLVRDPAAGAGDPPAAGR